MNILSLLKVLELFYFWEFENLGEFENVSPIGLGEFEIFQTSEKYGLIDFVESDNFENSGLIDLGEFEHFEKIIRNFRTNWFGGI